MFSCPPILDFGQSHHLREITGDLLRPDSRHSSCRGWLAWLVTPLRETHWTAGRRMSCLCSHWWKGRRVTGVMAVCSFLDDLPPCPGLFIFESFLCHQGSAHYCCLFFFFFFFKPHFRLQSASFASFWTQEQKPAMAALRRHTLNFPVYDNWLGFAPVAVLWG